MRKNPIKIAHVQSVRPALHSILSFCMFPGLLQRCELSGSGSGESNEKPSNDDVEEVDPVAEPPVQKKPASKLKKGRAEVESEVTNLGGKSGKDDEDNGDGDDCGALGGSDKKKKRASQSPRNRNMTRKRKALGNTKSDLGNKRVAMMVVPCLTKAQTTRRDALKLVMMT